MDFPLDIETLNTTEKCIDYIFEIIEHNHDDFILYNAGFLKGTPFFVPYPFHHLEDFYVKKFKPDVDKDMNIIEHKKDYYYVWDFSSIKKELLSLPPPVLQIYIYLFHERVYGL
jgi:hypothetical protein